MGRIPIGCVSLRDLAKEAGISKNTAIRYAKELGISGHISIGRSQEVVDAMWRLYATSIEAKRDRCRKGNRELKFDLVPVTELASLVGCSRCTARRILRNLGWPSDIPREKTSEAVAVIKETMAENARRQAERAAAGRWESAKKDGKSADWSWRVCIRGDRGWLVVRTGTKEEMTAWADVLVDNGIMAEARKNKYGGMA